jgi:hypothetical protein
MRVQIRLFTLMWISKQLLIKVILICHHWLKTLRDSILSLYACIVSVNGSP